jgi:threonine synthase
VAPASSACGRPSTKWSAWAGFLAAIDPDSSRCSRPAARPSPRPAFLDGKARTEPWPNPQTHAYGLRVPSPIGGFICVRVLRESNGTAALVTDEEADTATRQLGNRTGIDVCPEGGAAWSALQTLRASGFIRDQDRVVVFNTGTGLKYR